MLRNYSRLVLVGVLFAGGARLAAAPPQRDALGDLLPDGATARLGTLRLRHGDGVCQVLYSADGKWLVSLSRDRTCRVWDAQSGRLHCTIAEKDVDFYAVAFSADSTTLAVAGGDPFHGGNTGIRLFDVATGERTR